MPCEHQLWLDARVAACACVCVTPVGEIKFCWHGYIHCSSYLIYHCSYMVLGLSSSMFLGCTRLGCCDHSHFRSCLATCRNFSIPVRPLCGVLTKFSFPPITKKLPVIPFIKWSLSIQILEKLPTVMLQL